MLKSNKGLTFIELILTIPLILIVFTLGYNMLFIINKSHKIVSDDFSNAEDIRIFQINIQNEANQARKALLGSNEPNTEDITKAALVRESDGNRLRIYTYLDNNDYPVLVTYELKSGGKLERTERKATKTSFPYTFENNPSDTKIVLNNIANDKIFGIVEPLRVRSEGSQEGEDYRKKVDMNIEIKNRDGRTIGVNTYLITKSRATAE